MNGRYFTIIILHWKLQNNVADQKINIGEANELTSANTKFVWHSFLNSNCFSQFQHFDRTL